LFRATVSEDRLFVGGAGADEEGTRTFESKTLPVFKTHLTCSHTLKIERYPLSGFWLASAEKAKVLLGNGYFAGTSKVAFRRVN